MLGARTKITERDLAKRLGVTQVPARRFVNRSMWDYFNKLVAGKLFLGDLSYRKSVDLRGLRNAGGLRCLTRVNTHF